MLIETQNLVSTEKFRKHLDEYVTAAQGGRGPIAITQNSEIVGFFVGAEEYEAMVGAAVKKLLSARAKGPSMTHEQARAHLRDVARRSSRKP